MYTSDACRFFSFFYNVPDTTNITSHHLSTELISYSVGEVLSSRTNSRFRTFLDSSFERDEWGSFSSTTKVSAFQITVTSVST